MNTPKDFNASAPQLPPIALLKLQEGEQFEVFYPYGGSVKTFATNSAQSVIDFLKGQQKLHMCSVYAVKTRKVWDGAPE